MRELMAAVAVLTCCTLVTAPVAAAVPPAPALTVSVEDVRIIAGVTDLTPGEQLDRPGGQHQYDGQYPAACGAVLNQDAAFASGFNEFKSVTYNGAANRSVTQAVAVYPDPSAARAALTAVGSALRGCSELGAANMAVTTQVLDQKTFALCQTQCGTIYRAEGPVLISVSVSRFDDSARIATLVLQQITNRVGQ